LPLPLAIDAAAAAVRAEAPVRARHLERDAAMLAGVIRAGLRTLLMAGAVIPAALIRRDRCTQMALLGIAPLAPAFV